MDDKRKNDSAWEALFEKYDILNQIDLHERYFISADQIREYREPRLMAKFDHRVNLPDIFKKYSLAILPVSRKGYVLSHFDVYEKQEPIVSPVRQFRLPSYLESLRACDISSEEEALNCALCSGIFTDFLGEEALFSTVSGRRGSPDFSFFIRNTKTGKLASVDVSKSQLEVDAAYEGPGSLTLVEAKKEIGEDFLVRQLYYPYRMWHDKLKKEVRTVFLVFSNDIFSLYEYRFLEPGVYNSLTLFQQARYSVEDTAIRHGDLERILKTTAVKPEPKTPFPQANSFPRLINLCELLQEAPMTRAQITEEYAFDIRQTDYYSSAGEYLGLLEKSGPRGREEIVLTKTGRNIMEQPYRERQLSLCGRILSHEVFHRAMESYFRTGYLPDKGTIVRMMRDSSLAERMGESTILRRSGTVIGWLSWIRGLLTDRR